MTAASVERGFHCGLLIALDREAAITRVTTKLGGYVYNTPYQAS